MANPTDTFIATLTQTPQLAAALQANLQRLKDDDASIIQVLSYTKTLADDLDQLDDALTTTSELLTVVSVVPEVGEAAVALKDSIAVLSKEVTPARKAADQLEAEVKPFRDALENIESALDDAIKVTTEIQSASQTFLTAFTAVVNCINSLPDGTYKQQGEAYLDQFSSTAEPIVSTLNSVLSTTNQVITDFYAQVEKIVAALSPLNVIAPAVEQVLSVLQPLMGPLKDLENALKTIQIPIPLPYPHLVSLYDIFTEFSQFIDLAMAPIQGLVDDLLKALNVTLPSIPGLSDLINLHIDIPNIPDFEGLIASIEKPFEQLEAMIASFSLKCPPE